MPDARESCRSISTSTRCAPKMRDRPCRSPSDTRRTRTGWSTAGTPDLQDAFSMNPRFSLGIDLGTSNCAMAVADNDSDSTEVLQVMQIVAANQVGEMRTLPSSLYVPHPDEFPAGSFRL